MIILTQPPEDVTVLSRFPRYVVKPQTISVFRGRSKAVGIIHAVVSMRPPNPASGGLYLQGGSVTIRVPGGTIWIDPGKAGD